MKAETCSLVSFLDYILSPSYSKLCLDGVVHSYCITYCVLLFLHLLFHFILLLLLFELH
jgi:hypothetical protein